MMSGAGLGRVAIALACTALSAASSASSEDAGLRMEASLSVSSASSRDLVVMLNNVSSAPINVFLGERQRGIFWLFKFIATSPNGEQAGLAVTPDSFFPGTGYREPVMLDLPSGAVHEYRFALKQLIWIKQGGDSNLETLLQRGFTLHVSLQVDQEMKRAERILSAHFWTGHVVSAEIRATR